MDTHTLRRHSARHNMRLLLVVLVTLFTYALIPVGSVEAVTSELWGNNGELFNPAGRLPDISWAGYNNGTSLPPNVPQVINAVTQYGATGNDTTDDTIAIQNALNAANNGAVYLSAGTYYLNKPLQITKSNVVLRGAGASTILRPTVPLDTLLGVSFSTKDANYGNTAYVEIAPPNASRYPAWPSKYDVRQGGSRITSVTRGALRGDRQLTLASVTGLSVGQEIRLRMNEGGSATDPNSFGCYIQGGTACYETPGEAQWISGNHVDWIVKITAIAGSVITIERSLPYDVRTGWSPEIWTYIPLITNSGIENLTIKFPDEVYAGHHVEPGWHGVWFGSADNCWARNLSVLDSDRGIEVSASNRIYVGNIYFGEPFRKSGPPRAGYTGTNKTGHYGLSMNHLTQDSVAENINIDQHFVHNFSFATWATGNVYSNIRTLTAIGDLHGGGPNNNVYTDVVVVEEANDMFRSHRAGMNTTWWNIRRAYASTTNFDYWSNTTFPSMNLIGIERWPTRRVSGTSGIYIEKEVTTPTNLYRAQIAWRTGASPTPAPIPTPPTPPPTPTTCTNLQTTTASIPTGYGAAYNPLTTTKEYLIQASCTGTTQATVTVGNGNTTTYVYNRGYYYSGTTWTPYTLTCASGALIGGAWCPGKATASIPLPQNPQNVIAYTCQYTNSTWKCGCRDATCSTNYWQLQRLQR